MKGSRPSPPSKQHVNPGVDFLLSTVDKQPQQDTPKPGSGSMLLGLVLPLHPAGLFLPALLSYTEELCLAVWTVKVSHLCMEEKSCWTSGELDSEPLRWRRLRCLEILYCVTIKEPQKLVGGFYRARIRLRKQQRVVQAHKAYVIKPVVSLVQRLNLTSVITW